MAVHNVTTSATQVGTRAGTPDSYICLQNESDVDFYLDFDGSVNVLDSTTGYVLKVGGELILSAKEYKNPVRVLHASSGTKSLRYQEG